MAQKKKKRKPPQKKQVKRMSTSQKIMAVIGVFIILAMLLPGILSLLQ